MTATFGLSRADTRETFLGGSRLTNDLDVAVLLEELAHTAAHDFVVVEQEHADAHRQLPRLVRLSTLRPPRCQSGRPSRQGQRSRRIGAGRL